MPVKSLMPPVLGLLMGMNNMNDMKKMTDYETALERRLEKTCERNGWIASAHVAFGGDYVNCQLEKFGRRMEGQSPSLRILRVTTNSRCAIMSCERCGRKTSSRCNRVVASDN